MCPSGYRKRQHLKVRKEITSPASCCRERQDTPIPRSLSARDGRRKIKYRFVVEQEEERIVLRPSENSRSEKALLCKAKIKRLRVIVREEKRKGSRNNSTQLVYGLNV